MMYITEIYSEGEGKLLIGGAPESEAELLSWIKTYKITCFLNLMRERQYSHLLEAFQFYQLPECAYIQFPVTEGQAPSINQCRSLCLLIDNLLFHGHTILMHCRLGCGRAPTVAAAYLIRKNHWTINQTIQYLIEKQVCYPNFNGLIPSQMEFLKKWESLFIPIAKY